jgi:hypothetical protein
MRLGLYLKADVITFVFVRYFWELSIKQLLSVWHLFLLCVALSTPLLVLGEVAVCCSDRRSHDWGPERAQQAPMAAEG